MALKLTAYDPIGDVVGTTTSPRHPPPTSRRRSNGHQRDAEYRARADGLSSARAGRPRTTSAPSSRFDDLTLTYPPGTLPDISVSTPGGPFAVLQGQSTDVPVSLNRLNGPSGNVALTAGRLPSGVAVLFSRPTRCHCFRPQRPCTSRATLTAPHVRQSTEHHRDRRSRRQCRGRPGHAVRSDAPAGRDELHSQTELVHTGGGLGSRVWLGGRPVHLSRDRAFSQTVTLSLSGLPSTVTAQILPGTSIAPGGNFDVAGTIRLVRAGNELRQPDDDHDPRQLAGQSGEDTQPGDRPRRGKGDDRSGDRHPAPLPAARELRPRHRRRHLPRHPVRLWWGPVPGHGRRRRPAGSPSPCPTAREPARSRSSRPPAPGSVNVTCLTRSRSRPSQARRGSRSTTTPSAHLSFGELVDQYGNGLYIHINPCIFVDCTINTFIPDPTAADRVAGARLPARPIGRPLLRDQPRNPGDAGRRHQPDAVQLLGYSDPRSRIGLRARARISVTGSTPSIRLKARLSSSTPGPPAPRTSTSNGIAPTTSSPLGRSPIITLQNGSFLSGEGHAVLAYDEQDVPDGHDILVYDNDGHDGADNTQKVHISADWKLVIRHREREHLVRGPEHVVRGPPLRHPHHAAAARSSARCSDGPDHDLRLRGRRRDHHHRLPWRGRAPGARRPRRARIRRRVCRRPRDRTGLADDHRGQAGQLRGDDHRIRISPRAPKAS